MHPRTSSSSWGPVGAERYGQTLSRPSFCCTHRVAECNGNEAPKWHRPSLIRTSYPRPIVGSLIRCGIGRRYLYIPACGVSLTMEKNGRNLSATKGQRVWTSNFSRHDICTARGRTILQVVVAPSTVYCNIFRGVHTVVRAPGLSSICPRKRVGIFFIFILIMLLWVNFAIHVLDIC